MTHRILIIEKENSLRNNLKQHLLQEGFQVCVAERVDEVMGLLNASRIHLVLLSLEALKRDGMIIMREIRERFAHINIITINSGDQLELSIESMRLGAYDDFLIPFDLDALIRRIQSAMENKTSHPVGSKS